MVARVNPEIQTEQNRTHSTQLRGSDVKQEPLSRAVSLPDADLCAAWLAELDDLVTVAADVTEEPAVRLGAVGTVAMRADEISESLVSSALPSEQSEDSDFGERSRELTRAIGERLDQIGRLLDDSILPELAEQESIHVVDLESLDEQQRGWLRTSFMQQIFPLLTPLAVDPGRPFPNLESGDLTLLAVLHNRGDDLRYDGPLFALVQVPEALARWLPIARSGKDVAAGHWFDVQTYGPGIYAWSESVIRHHVNLLFPGMDVVGTYLFRILRVERPIPASDDGQASPHADSLSLLRLDIEEPMPPAVRQWLARHLDVPNQSIVRSHPSLAMADLIHDC